MFDFSTTTVQFTADWPVLAVIIGFYCLGILLLHWALDKRKRPTN